MKKRILALALMSIALVACGGSNNCCEQSSESVSVETVHTHEWTTTYDEVNHYEECTCGEKQNETAHSYVDVEENGYVVPTCSCGHTGTPVEVSNVISIYFSAPAEGWGDKAYCYLWDSETQTNNKDWPGEEMEYVGSNGYGQRIYTFEVDLDSFDMIIINNGSGWQSVDTSLSGISHYTGFYLNDDRTLGTYTFEDSFIENK